MPLFFECWNVIKLNKDVPIFSDVLVLASTRNHWIDANEYPAFFVVPIKAAAEVAQFVHPSFASQCCAFAFRTTISVDLKRLRTGRSVEVNSSSGSLILQQQIAAD